ncbi:unnamed protein product, partial [Brassica oleracea var. botrytis]
ACCFCGTTVDKHPLNNWGNGALRAGKNPLCAFFLLVDSFIFSPTIRSLPLIATFPSDLHLSVSNLRFRLSAPP